MLTFDPHPRLIPAAFTTAFPAPLGEGSGLAEFQALLSGEAAAPVERSEELRGAVRDLLRFGGYKPTGRGKPSSEYLVRAVGEGKLPSINAAVDACNAVSFRSGLPISVVDLGRATAPLAVRVVEEGRYVFNASGQELDVGGLLCLWDADGPCANAVKDAQRTKTDGSTHETLSVLWAPVGFEEHTAATLAWYRELLEGAGATTSAAVN